MTQLKTASLLLLVGIATLGLANAARTRLFDGGDDAGQTPLPARAVAADPAKIGPESWPAGIMVSGRVVDHRGAAVAGADVLLLGSEQLTVWADPGPREGQVRYNLSTQPGRPDRVRQDRRSGSILPAAAGVTREPHRGGLRADAALGGDLPASGRRERPHDRTARARSVDDPRRGPGEADQVGVLDRRAVARQGRLGVGFDLIPTYQSRRTLACASFSRFHPVSTPSNGSTSRRREARATAS